MKRPPALLFGVPVADVTMDETIDAIGDLVTRGRSTGRTHQVATVNVDFLTNAFADESLRSILTRADLCIADGMPLVWSARTLGMPLRERVAGADLVPLLFDRSQQTGWRIHVFGSSPDVAGRSRAVIAERWPNARVTIDPGPMIPDVDVVDDEVLDSIAEVDADILCVALGNPKQEFFIERHRERLGVPVMIGVGGSLDLLVGEKKRAPAWMQRAGLEWIARAAQEPRRLGKRYAHDIRVIGPRLAADLRSHRRRSGGADVTVAVDDGNVVARLGCGEPLATASYTTAANALAAGARLELHAAASSTITERAAAAIIGLVSIARSSEATVSWPDPPGADLLADADLLGVEPAMWGLD